MDKQLMNPRRMTDHDVKTVMLQLMPSLPPEVTLEAMLPELIEIIADISDRITMKQTSDLIMVAAVLARSVAVMDPRVSVQVKIDGGTCQ